MTFPGMDGWSRMRRGRKVRRGRMPRPALRMSALPGSRPAPALAGLRKLRLDGAQEIGETDGFGEHELAAGVDAALGAHLTIGDEGGYHHHRDGSEKPK